jgi:hypothetical protein
MAKEVYLQINYKAPFCARAALKIYLVLGEGNLFAGMNVYSFRHYEIPIVRMC